MLKAAPPSPPQPRETIDVVATINACAAGAAVAGGLCAAIADAANRAELYALRSLGLGSGLVLLATIPVTAYVFCGKRSEGASRKMWFSFASAAAGICYYVWWLQSPGMNVR